MHGLLERGREGSMHGLLEREGERGACMENETMISTVETLPTECLSLVISFTSPRDACCSSLVSRTFLKAADSDVVWDHFLPSDYPEILSDHPIAFSSKKDLFMMLSSTPILIHGAKKAFWLEKTTSKKCYMLSARELSIAWAADPLYWCWKRLICSRFPESVELVMVSWLEIKARMSTKALSPNTTYAAYLVFEIANRAFGLHVLPMEVSLEMGSWTTRGMIWLNKGLTDGGDGGVYERGDGWLEVKLGDFYTHESDSEVVMEFKEIKGDHLKGGLVIEGIEIRPNSHYI